MHWGEISLSARCAGYACFAGTKSFHLVIYDLVELCVAMEVVIRIPRVEIEYCTQCQWLLRAAWIAQELLTTFREELGEVALVPGTGGVFDIRIDGQLIWSRAEALGFPDIKQLKQLVRDRVAPTKDLGHSDRPKDAGSEATDLGATTQN